MIERVLARTYRSRCSVHELFDAFEEGAAAFESHFVGEVSDFDAALRCACVSTRRSTRARSSASSVTIAGSTSSLFCAITR